MAERVVEHERDVIRVPRVLSDVAVLIEPLSIATQAGAALRAVLRRFPFERPSQNALVLGAGPIGLLGAMMFVARANDVVVYSLEPSDSDRARLVRSFGAEYVSARDTPLSELRARIGLRDIVYEAVGTAKVAFGVLDVINPNGVLVLTGIPGKRPPVEMELDRLMRGLVLDNQVVLGTANASRSSYESAIRHLEQFMTLFPAAVRDLITERAPLADAPALLRKTGGIKQVISLAA
jgi:threonine dehydrogenase-like Zn-dependent dehydrogenase